MAFITDGELATRVAAMMHIDSGAMESHWDTIIPDANTSAYGEIKSKLLDRGYTLAQIDAWDRGPEFNKAIGMYRALIFGVTGEAYDDTWPEKLKYWLDQLDTVPVAINDVIVDPLADANAYVGHGDLATTNDIFVLDTEDRGNVTEW